MSLRYGGFQGESLPILEQALLISIFMFYICVCKRTRHILDKNPCPTIIMYICMVYKMRIEIFVTQLASSYLFRSYIIMTSNNTKKTNKHQSKTFWQATKIIIPTIVIQYYLLLRKENKQTQTIYTA